MFAVASLKKCARQHRDRLRQGDRRQGGRQLCRLVGARQADRAGCVGRRVHLADLQWMDSANEHKLGKADTRFNPLGNRLVLIAPKDSKLDKVAVSDAFALAKRAGDGRIAVADVKAVPAGRQSKAVLDREVI